MTSERRRWGRDARAVPGQGRRRRRRPWPRDGNVPQPGGLCAAAAAAWRARGRRQRPGGSVQLPHLPGSVPSACGHRQLRPHVLRRVPPALPAGAIAPVPTVSPALRPQEGGQGHPCGEAALVLQGPLPGLQQKGDDGDSEAGLEPGGGAAGSMGSIPDPSQPSPPGPEPTLLPLLPHGGEPPETDCNTSQDEGARLLLCEGPGADGQLPQVRPRGAHGPAHPQRRPQQVHLHLPLLRRPQPGPAGAGEALCGQPSQRPQPCGVPRLLGHALGRPRLQEHQLPAAPAPPPQVLLRHLRGLQHRRGGCLPGRPGPVSLRKLTAWPSLRDGALPPGGTATLALCSPAPTPEAPCRPGGAPSLLEEMHPDATQDREAGSLTLGLPPMLRRCFGASLWGLRGVGRLSQSHDVLSVPRGTPSG